MFQFNDRAIGGKTPGVGLLVNGGSPAIRNNQFIHNNTGLLLETGAAPTIEGNNFEQNKGMAIQTINAYPTFSRNRAQHNGMNGIHIQGALAKDYTLFPDLPYIIQGVTYTTPTGKTLTIDPGTIIKLQGSGSLSISGTLNAQGTSEKNIIFTSIFDDDCGIAGGCGDTDGTSTAPKAGDWEHLTFNSGSYASVLNHVTIRYGGTRSLVNPDKGALRVNDTSIAIKNALIEQNYRMGMVLKNSTSTSINSVLIQDHQEPLAPVSEPSYGLLLINSSPHLSDTHFKNNKIGISGDRTSSVTNGGNITFEHNGINMIPPDLIP